MVLKLARKHDARAYQYLCVLSKTHGATVVEYIGASTINILTDKLCYWPWVKAFAKKIAIQLGKLHE